MKTETETTRQKATYVALTTEGGTWWVEAMGMPGETRDSVENRATAQIVGDQYDKAKDIFVDTRLKNLTVVSLSRARRHFRRAMNVWSNDL